MDYLTTDYAGVSYVGFSADQLSAAGVPQAVIKAVGKAARRELIKTECRRRIYAIGTSEAQINVTAMAAAIGAKAASARSAQDTALITTAQASIDWVMAMRARFAELADVETDADYLADASWPACPADVVALYQQF